MQSMESTGIRPMLHIAVVDGGFPKGFAKPIGGANVLFGMMFAENCMNEKHWNGREDVSWRASPQIRHSNGRAKYY